MNFWTTLPRTIFFLPLLISTLVACGGGGGDNNNGTSGADAYEEDDNYGQETPITAPTNQFHNHFDDGVDAYTFNAVAGTTYVFETTALGPRADTVIVLYNASQTYITEDDDSGVDSERASSLVWTAPDNGTYFVVAFAYDDIENVGNETEYTFHFDTL